MTRILAVPLPPLPPYLPSCQGLSLGLQYLGYWHSPPNQLPKDTVLPAPGNHCLGGVPAEKKNYERNIASRVGN